MSYPALVLWSEHGALQKWYDTLGIWRGWADNVRGRPLDCGSFPKKRRTRPMLNCAPS